MVRCKPARRSPNVWIVRWREQTPEGRVKRKVVVGTVQQYRSKAAAQKAAAALRGNINKRLGCRQQWNSWSLTTQRIAQQGSHDPCGVRKVHSHLGRAVLGRPLCVRREDRRSRRMAKTSSAGKFIIRQCVESVHELGTRSFRGAYSVQPTDTAEPISYAYSVRVRTTGFIII